MNLRGMELLHGSRQRRERDAEAEVARHLGEVRRAELAVRRAQEAADAQRANWRRREHEALLAMREAAASPALLAAHWVEMNWLADEAVRLQADHDDAEEKRAGAEEALDHAHAALRQAGRLVQRSDAVLARVRDWRRHTGEAAEVMEAEEDAIRRHAARCAG